MSATEGKIFTLRYVKKIMSYSKSVYFKKWIKYVKIITKTEIKNKLNSRFNSTEKGIHKIEVRLKKITCTVVRGAKWKKHEREAKRYEEKMKRLNWSHLDFHKERTERMGKR